MAGLLGASGSVAGHGSSRYSFSQHSTRSSGLSAGESMASLESDDLVQQTDYILSSNEQLERENAVMYAFLLRHNRELAERDDSDEIARKARRGAKKKTKYLQLVPLEQRTDAAQREVDALRAELARAEAEGKRLLESLDAVREETDTRISELKRAAFEFKRDVLMAAPAVAHNSAALGATGASTTSAAAAAASASSAAAAAGGAATGETVSMAGLPAERVQRYMDDVLKQCGSLLDKLMLKNDVLRQRIRKIRASLKEKEQLGDNLGQVDFDQLKIENKQFFEKIQERNRELLRLKLTAGNTLQLLNTFKGRLGELVSEGEWLQREITSRKEFVTKTAEEGQRAVAHRERLSTVHRRLNDRITGTKAPAVLDYVNQKDREFQLRKQIADYQRKLEIAQMEAARVRAKERDLQRRSLGSSVGTANTIGNYSGLGHL